MPHWYADYSLPVRPRNLSRQGWCARDGGGTVYVAPGTWLTGTVYLEDHITMPLAPGCTVLGTTDKRQYGPPRPSLGAKGEQYSTWAIFAGKDLQHIAICGRGTIDGQGAHFKYKDGARPKPNIGTFRNVVVSHIVATDCSAVGCSITGLPGHRIENVTLDHISLAFDGGGTKEDASRAIGEKPGSYPESTMFGTLGACGLFCRHVEGLVLHNVRLHTSEPDHRHAMVLDDVQEAVIDSLDAPFAEGGAAMLKLTDARRVAIRNCRPPADTKVFLTLHGAQTGTISVYDNDLGGAETVCDRARDVPESALAMWSNLAGR